MSEKKANMICEDCGYIGISKTKYSGSLWIEILLYLVALAVSVQTIFISLLVPFVYSIHRRSDTKEVCEKCGGNVFNIHKPRGKELIREMENKQT